MRVLEYKLVQDRNQQPLVSIESPLGNGLELYPDQLRRLALELTEIAAEAEAHNMGKSYRPMKKTKQY